MLTAQRAFDGDDVAVVLANLIERDPDWAVLPARLSVPIRRLLRRCLQKDSRRRLADVADARLEIEEPCAGGERMGHFFGGAHRFRPATETLAHHAGERAASHALA